MPSDWIISKSSVRYVALTAIVVGCSGGSDASAPPEQQPFGAAGWGQGGYPGQAGFQGTSGFPQQPPPPPATCGNGVLDPGEQCEGGTAQTCAQLTMGTRPIGNVLCTNCYIDGNGCMPQQGGGGVPPIGAGGAGGEFGAGGAIVPPPPPPPPPGNGGAGPIDPPPPVGSKSPTVPAVTAQCPNFVNGTITFMGLGGIQIVAGAKAASPTAPMVFYWHGTGSTAGEFGFMAAAVRDGVVQEGGVLVSFQGTTGGDLWSGTSIFGKGDLNLVDQLYACAVQNHNVDPRRVFATGCSAGGLFSGAMAAARSSYVAAAAPNSGGWVAPVPFQNDHTPALMTIHGAPGSDVVVIDFSQSSATADNAFKARGGFVINCNHGGGHCGGSGQAPSIWQFFKSHPYGVDPEPYAGGLPAGFSSVCKIF